MIDPFPMWYRLGQAALKMSATAARAMETTAATPEIVAKRTVMIAEAMWSPLTGNYGELSRMIPEKAAAFSATWTAVATDMLTMQAAWWGEMASVSAALSHGRLPTMIEAGVAVDRLARANVRSVEHAADLGTVALAPVARQVKTNIRRLRRSSSPRAER